MPRGKRRAVLGCLLLLVSVPAAAFDLARLSLPPGFHIAIYADHVPQARQLALGAHGVLFIGSSGAGRVYAAQDRDGDGVAETVTVVAHGLYLPAGVAFRDGSLYVAEINRILRFDNIEAHLAQPPAPVVVIDGLPESSHHGLKFIGFGPDHALYFAVGVPCNICAYESPFGTLVRVPAGGGGAQIHALGLRNSVGFDWHPDSGELWFSDNGRDGLGDDLPADELNRVTRAGEHFGFPYVHGGDVVDADFGQGHLPAEFTAPARKLGAHVAPLGLMFYRGRQFPAAYHHALFVAEHGSWDRSHKVGCRVMVATIDGQGAVTRYAPFITGWLADEESWGQPVAFATLVDGSLLISDDQAGVVYRVSYVAR